MMKKILRKTFALAIISALLAGCGQNAAQTSGSPSTPQESVKPTPVATAAAAATNPAPQPTELQGEITMWHSFTQGPRLEAIQAAADDFIKANPKVKITIETFSWGEFYTKWTTGLATGQVPDLSTALPNHVVEMIDADAIVPLNDLIGKIGKDRFYEAPLREMTIDDKTYAVPLYSHAQVMWIRKDLLEKAGLQVPKTWDELYATAKALTNAPEQYGLSVPMGLGDLMATRFLNFYVRSAGETLLTKDGKANLTSKAAIDGINYWVKMYKEISPKDSVNFKVLDQATLYYQGITAFDFNSGFQIGGVNTNSPQLMEFIDAAPLPMINANDKRQGVETSNIPMVVWKKGSNQDISKAFIEFLYEKDRYVKFLHSVPAGMLPAFKDITSDPAYLNNDTMKKFANAVEVIGEAVNIGTAIGFENGPRPEAGILTSQGVIEQMFQDIVLQNIPVEQAAKDAEEKLNQLFKTVG